MKIRRQLFELSYSTNTQRQNHNLLGGGNDCNAPARSLVNCNRRTINRPVYDDDDDDDDDDDECKRAAKHTFCQRPWRLGGSYN